MPKIISISLSNKLVNTMKIQPLNCGVKSVSEKNDCTVRALANAANLDYEKAHGLLAKHGRPACRGALCRTSHAAYIEAGLELIGVFGVTHRAAILSRIASRPRSAGMTLSRVLPRLNSGRYVVLVTGHALAVINGQVIDSFASSGGKSVFAIYKV
jgi:hypothetical protein